MQPELHSAVNKRSGRDLYHIPADLKDLPSQDTQAGYLQSRYIQAVLFQPPEEPGLSTEYPLLNQVGITVQRSCISVVLLT